MLTDVFSLGCCIAHTLLCPYVASCNIGQAGIEALAAGIDKHDNGQWLHALFCIPGPALRVGQEVQIHGEDTVLASIPIYGEEDEPENWRGHYGSYQNQMVCPIRVEWLKSESIEVDDGQWHKVMQIEPCHDKTKVKLDSGTFYCDVHAFEASNRLRTAWAKNRPGCIGGVDCASEKWASWPEPEDASVTTARSATPAFVLQVAPFQRTSAFESDTGLALRSPSANVADARKRSRPQRGNGVGD